MNAESVKAELQKYASKSDAVFLQRFFKTGPGQYGEGDKFIGVRVPAIRKACKQYQGLGLNEVQKLIKSPVHEHRMAGLIILTLQYPRADEAGREKIFGFYMDSVFKGHVNNWDLVDVTAPKVVGQHLFNDRKLLYELARSNKLWQKRVAVLSTFTYINEADANTSLDLAKILLHDKHDLIQKAVGWMLREIGKRIDRKLLISFLDEHAHEMPRTMLRYSIEHLPVEQRRYYLKQKIS